MSNIEEDLQQTLKLISADWGMQNNKDDKATGFIYKMNSLDECLENIKKQNVNKEYALHRWYNYMTSIHSEHIFCEFGAVHEKNIYSHDVDIYIDKVPFDVKLTVYPQKLSSRPYDLTTRKGKNEMIKWYYENQSQQGRKQLINRLYVVCDGKDSDECMKMKSDFALMRKAIGEYMDSVKTKGLHQQVITDGDRKYLVKSDIILLKY